MSTLILGWAIGVISYLLAAVLVGVMFAYIFDLNKTTLTKPERFVVCLTFWPITLTLAIIGALMLLAVIAAIEIRSRFGPQ